jgi:IclR family mhp operon transcriptional activator
MRSFPAVQSIVRALQLLTEINRLGTATVAELHRRTQIPKPTIVRMVETMMGEGYVYKDHRMGGYQVTGKAAGLSSGYHGAPLVLEVARPWAIDLTRRVQWPASLCTLDAEGDGVVVQYSTIPDSPLSPFHSTVGVKLSLGARALGRAYLCFCPEHERAILLDVLSKSANAENRLERAALDRLVATARRNGYAERDSKVRPRNSATIAVPLMQGERVLATFGLTYFRSAIRPSALHRRIVEPLKESAAGIERELRSLAR